MRKLQIMLLMCGLAGVFTPSLADQTDPRLDGLFVRLKEVSVAGEVPGIESQILDIWLETPDQQAGPLLQRGIIAMRLGDFRSARTTFDQVIAMAPDFAEGWNQRATVQYLMGNFDNSLNDIAATLRLEPRHFGALSGRGLVYIQLEDLESALGSFEEALAVSPYMAGPRANADALRTILKGRAI